MSTESTTTETTDLSASCRDLLAAIRDALDVPRNADVRDDHKFEMLQRERAVMTRGSIKAVIAGDSSPEIMTQVIRDLTRESPVTYRVYEPSPDAQDSPTAVTR